MANTIKMTVDVKVVNGQQVIDVTTDVRKLGEEFKRGQNRVKSFKDHMVTLGQAGQVFQNLASSISQVTQVLNDLTAAYNTQIQAESQLEVAMRNTMNATEADIQAIKDLASEQQKLGVVGDEVQLAGAKELAMHVKRRESLEKLIPVMNDLAVKQDGLNVSSGTTTAMAQLLGKALEGNTGALKRAGIVLTDAQEQIMKLGTEEQRVATLTAAIEARVGGMNAQLAQTDGGRAQQAANDIGDLKESIGSWFSGMQPALASADMLTRTISSLGVAAISVAGVVKMLAKANAALATSCRAGAVAANALKWAVRGLISATVVGAAIAALTWAIEALFNTADDSNIDQLSEEQQRAAEAADRLRRSQEQLRQEIDDVRTQLALNIARTKDFNGTKAEEKKLVDELNKTYGQTMGYFSSVAQWYNTLTANSETYCRQLVLEAQARQLANQIAEDEIALDKRRQALAGLSREDKTETTVTYETRTGEDQFGMATTKTVPVRHTRSISGTSPYAVERDAITTAEGAIELRKERLQKLLDEMKKLSLPVKGAAAPLGSGGRGGGSTNKTLQLIADAKTYDELTNNLRYYDEQLHKTDATDTERLKTLAMARAATAQARDELDKLVKSYTAAEPIADDQIRTFEQLEQKLQYYRKQLNEADGAGRIAAQQGINRLEKLRTEWQSQLDVMGQFSSVLDSVKKKFKGEGGGKAESYASTLGIGKKIAEWTKDLDGRKAGDMGFGELTDKINELKKALADLGDAGTAKQRSELQSLIDKYEEWRRAAVMSMDTVKEGWGGLKGIGDGVKSLTDALSGNGDAWSVITGVIDSAFKIYDGITAVLGIINMLTQTATATKTAEAAAETTSATAGAANLGITEAQAAASAAAVPALEAESASWVELAAARIFAAHAMIPFAGPGIAAGLVATMGASIVAAKGAVMALAEGGVAYGPQFALVGEYAGARSNPEVVAPLDKLRGMLDGGTGGEVEFRIQGRTLVGLLNKEYKHKART